jgi:molybdate transport system substrate-binding protein
MRILIALVCVVAVAACGRSDAPTGDSAGNAAADGPLVVAAASDLRDAFGELAGTLRETPVGEVSFVFGSSGMLREQILNGAPYDVYVSANVDFVDEVIASGRTVSSEPTLYAVGGLAVVASDDRDLVSPEQAVVTAERIVIAQPRHAPYGAAARQMLERLGVWSEVEPRIVYADNVADAVRIVESGEVDVGIVARSLVIDEPHLVVDPALHDPLRQAAVALKGNNLDRAVAFVDALRSESVRGLLARYGFVTDDASVDAVAGGG